MNPKLVYLNYCTKDEGEGINDYNTVWTRMGVYGQSILALQYHQLFNYSWPKCVLKEHT